MSSFSDLATKSTATKTPMSTIHALSLLSLFLFLRHYSLLLTFSLNNAASLIAAVLLSFFSDMTIHMNVKMEQLTLGFSPVLKEDLPAGASDME